MNINMTVEMTNWTKTKIEITKEAYEAYANMFLKKTVN